MLVLRGIVVWTVKGTEMTAIATARFAFGDAERRSAEMSGGTMTMHQLEWPSFVGSLSACGLRNWAIGTLRAVS